MLGDFSKQMSFNHCLRFVRLASQTNAPWDAERAMPHERVSKLICMRYNASRKHLRLRPLATL